VRRPSAPLIAAVALSSLLAACSSDGNEPSKTPAQKPPQTIQLEVSKKGFSAPKEIPQEPVQIVLSNSTKQPQQAFFARINTGVKPKKVLDALQKNPNAAFALVTTAGSVPVAKPGETSSVVVEFPQGRFLILNPESKTPLEPARFAVHAGSGGAVSPPASDYSMEVGEYYFKIETPLKPGTLTIDVTNAGKQGHEIILQPKKGKGGGFSFAPAPGGEEWVTFDLKPGTYTLVCHFKDPKTGKEHSKLGMKRTIKVSKA
jgi:plastocyanin